MFTKSRIFILILTLLCFVVWLASDLIKTPPSFTPDEATQKALVPLDSNFDQKALEEIAKSNFSLPPFNPRAVPQPVITRTSPTPTPTPTSRSVIPLPLPTATSSGSTSQP